MALIAGFGNPLLDLTVKTNDENALLPLLQKYNLNVDDQIEFEECKMKSLLNDIKNFNLEHTPGGCAQNTLRIFQWLLGSPKSTYIIGGIGNDENGRLLKKLVEDAGVETLYTINKKLHTGISVALISGVNRSLIALISAAESINIESFNEISNNCTILNDIPLYYMEGFFIPKREEFAKHILQHSKKMNKLFAFNICAPYICKENPIVIDFVQRCDILFGNHQEYVALSEIMGFSGDVLEFALELSKTDMNIDWKFKKIIIMTNGSKTVTCIYDNGQIHEIDVPKISRGEIKDTTGAGDSFVSGFLYGLFENYAPETCVKYGCWTAGNIIKEIGCKVPDHSPQLQEISQYVNNSH